MLDFPPAIDQNGLRVVVRENRGRPGVEMLHRHIRKREVNNLESKPAQAKGFHPSTRSSHETAHLDFRRRLAIVAAACRPETTSTEGEIKPGVTTQAETARSRMASWASSTGNDGTGNPGIWPASRTASS